MKAEKNLEVVLTMDDEVTKVFKELSDAVSNLSERLDNLEKLHDRLVRSVGGYTILY